MILVNFWGKERVGVWKICVVTNLIYVPWVGPFHFQPSWPIVGDVYLMWRDQAKSVSFTLASDKCQSIVLSSPERRNTCHMAWGRQQRVLQGNTVSPEAWNSDSASPAASGHLPSQSSWTVAPSFQEQCTVPTKQAHPNHPTTTKRSQVPRP